MSSFSPWAAVTLHPGLPKKKAALVIVIKPGRLAGRGRHPKQVPKILLAAVVRPPDNSLP